ATTGHCSSNVSQYQAVLCEAAEQEVLGEAKNVTVSESCGKHPDGAGGSDAATSFDMRSRCGLGRRKLRNAVRRRSHRPVPAFEKVPAEVGEVAPSFGSQDEVLEELAKSKSTYHQVAHPCRQHQKRSRTQGLEQHQQKPRRCLCRRPASSKHEQVSQRHQREAGETSGPEVWTQPLDPRRQSVRVAPSVRVQDAVERRSSGACAGAPYKPSLPRVGGRLRSCVGRESSGASKICLRPVRVLRQRRLGCCCKC